MTIALLGWGSLIWTPGSLEVEKEGNNNIWCNEGPILPIEFSRISKNERLTLVLDKDDGTFLQTLYSISRFKEVDEAILNLATREGTGKSKIGYYNKTSKKFYPEGFDFRQSILDWVSAKNIDAVIWTNLLPNFEDKTGKEFNIDHVLDYLNNLPGPSKALAEEYIRRTPVQISTRMRNVIENALGWKPISA